jgi:aspartyl-tRNA(Asn)/glutamyl-tRNA(Gln) amidotransferase subunit C
MSSPINKKTLEYLAELARIELDSREEEKLLKDLQKILDYFEELKVLDTKNIEPLTGPHSAEGYEKASGTSLKNVFRDDGERQKTNHGAGVEAFPETHDGFLKIPPVFE